MQRQKVRSSNVMSVGYAPDTRRLEVEFNNGGVYQYEDVPLLIYEALLKSSSIGGFLHQQVKPKFACRKVA